MKKAKHTLKSSRRIYISICERNRETKEPVTFRGQELVHGWPVYLAVCQDIESLKTERAKGLRRVEYNRRKWGADWRRNPQAMIAAHKPCHDCACVAGEYHAIGCDLEQCPKCEGQLISCGCFKLD